MSAERQGHHLAVETTKPDPRLELLHTNVNKCGTIFNMLSGATGPSGSR